jgi:hypothetical protein
MLGHAHARLTGLSPTGLSPTGLSPAGLDTVGLDSEQCPTNVGTNAAFERSAGAHTGFFAIPGDGATQ